MPRGYPTNMSEGLRARLVASYVGGATIRELVRDTEMSYFTVHSALSGAGVLRPRGVRPGSQVGSRRYTPGVPESAARPTQAHDVDAELREHFFGAPEPHEEDSGE